MTEDKTTGKRDDEDEAATPGTEPTAPDAAGNGAEPAEEIRDPEAKRRADEAYKARQRLKASQAEADTLHAQLNAVRRSMIAASKPFAVIDERARADAMGMIGDDELDGLFAPDGSIDETAVSERVETLLVERPYMAGNVDVNAAVEKALNRLLGGNGGGTFAAGVARQRFRELAAIVSSETRSILDGGDEPEPERNHEGLNPQQVAERAARQSTHMPGPVRIQTADPLADAIAKAARRR